MYKPDPNLEEHLGGHQGKTHLDHGALKYIMETCRIESFLDIGCGPGGMVELAEKYGLKSYGIDGDYTVERYNPNKFLIHDFTKGPAPVTSQYDLAWSVEFVEHVYEEFVPNYMKAFQQCKYAMITYAPPGWEGHHHVNLQEEQYWIDKFKEYGFDYNEEITNGVRENTTLRMGSPKKRAKAFIHNRGLFFERSSD